MVAIFGAGAIGAAVAHRLAERGRFRQVRIIDDAADVAAGKALDVQQSAPISLFHTQVSADRDVLAAAGASMIVVADRVNGGEWDTASGTGLVDTLVRGGSRAPIVFAGPSQLELMESIARAGRITADRLLATAGSAIVGAASALVSLEWNGSASEINLVVAGRPPRFVVGWSSANAGGLPIESRVAAHRLIALSDSLAKLWPPGAQAIAAATAPIVEALAFGSRRLHQAAAMLDGEFGVRGAAGMMPLELGHGRVKRRVMPSLSPVELGAVQTSFKAATRI